MDKKNLDELFREKFETFREVPDEKVWTDIERSLDKKRKKRVVPLWWKLGGVAAVLAILLLAVYPWDTMDEGTPAVTGTDSTEGSARDGKGAEKNENSTDSDRTDFDNNGVKQDAFPVSESSEDAVVEGSKAAEEKNTERFDRSDKEVLSNGETGPDDGVVATEATSERNSGVAGTAAASGQNSSNRGEMDGTKNSGSEHPDKTQIAATENRQNTENEEHENKIDKYKNPFPSGEATLIIGDDDQEGVADGKAKKDTLLSPAGNNKSLAVGNTSKDSLSDLTENDFQKRDQVAKAMDNTKKRIDEGGQQIAQNDRADQNDGKSRNDGPPKDYENTQDDADSLGQNKKSILEEIEALNEDGGVAETSGSRWSAGPSIAPVYFNAQGEGSPIDPGFSSNPKSGSTNLSYGLSVVYAVTERLSVRSGIHRAEYGYDTDNVGFSPTSEAFSSGRLQNVDYTGSSNNLAVSDAVSNSESFDNADPEFSSLNSVRDGTVAQSFGYLEVPLELNYALIDRRFGFNLVGGISSLFLLNNSVILRLGDLNTEIGKASNLNDLNFSTNLGFGVNYKFTPGVHLSIEPVFKYQLNTFSDVSGDFRPYSIGVYSGLNFRF